MTAKIQIIQLKFKTTRENLLFILIIHISDIVAVPKKLKNIPVLIKATLTNN